MQFDVLTLFPEMIESLNQSIIGKGKEKGKGKGKVKGKIIIA